MKKKLVTTIIVAIISMELLACGSNNSVTVDNAETADVSSTTENLTEEDEQNKEIAEETNTETQNKETENKENLKKVEKC